MALTIARPMPLLAPVTTAIDPSSPRSMTSETLIFEPDQDGVGHLSPPMVDRERVPATLELLELGHRGRLAVLLEGRSSDDVRHRMVLEPRDEEKRPASLVAGLDGGR